MLENSIRNQTSTYHSVTVLLTLSNLEIQATKVKVWKFSSLGNKCFLRHYPYHSPERYRLIHIYRELRQQIKAELMYVYMILNVSLSPKWETVIFIWTLSPVKCALSRLEAKAVSQGCAWSKNVLKMTFSLVTTCVSVTLFLSPENKAYLFAQRFNVISVCHKTKCGIDEDIPQYQLAFDYLADKNSSVNEKESKMKKLTEITMQLIFP